MTEVARAPRAWFGPAWRQVPQIAAVAFAQNSVTCEFDADFANVRVLACAATTVNATPFLIALRRD